MEGKKKCARCKKFLSVDKFSKDPRHVDGLQSSCTPCRVEDNRQRKFRYKEAGLCQWCGVYPPRTNLTTCEECEVRRKIVSLEIKLAAFDNYGGRLCSCCGESNIVFLTIDHLDNNGSKHRKEITTTIFRWLRNNNYPKGFQVLCWNCNLGKYYCKGTCPHKL